MKKKFFCILLSVALLLSVAVTVLCLVSLISEIQKQEWLLFDLQWLKPISYKSEFSYSLAVNIVAFIFSFLLCITLSFLIIYFNRADISKLTKSSVQVYRDRKAARQEAKRQKKIQQAKDTIAELEDKEKDGE